MWTGKVVAKFKIAEHFMLEFADNQFDFQSIRKASMPERNPMGSMPLTQSR